MLLDFVVRVAVCKQEVGRAVVVVIEKFHAPAAHQARDLANAIRNGHIVEGLIAIVVVKRIHLLVYVGDEQVHPAVLVVVGGVHPHPGARPPLGAVAHVGLKAYLFELPIATIDKQEIRHCVIGDE